MTLVLSQCYRFVTILLNEEGWGTQDIDSK